jgi:carbon starvation protein
MLAAIALVLCTVVLFKMKRQRYAWVTIVPTAWLVLCTVTAGLEKVFSPDTAVGFVSHALRFGNAVAAGQILAPAKTLHEMSRIIFNDYLDASLAGLFAAIVVVMVIYGILDARKALGRTQSTALEVGGGVAMAGGGDD